MQYPESSQYDLIQGSPVQINLDKIQHRTTSRSLRLPAPRSLSYYCVYRTTFVRRFDDQPDFGARLGLVCLEGRGVRGGPGLHVLPGEGGPPRLEATLGSLRSHGHPQFRGFDLQDGLLEFDRALEARGCRRGLLDFRRAPEV